VVNAKKTGTPQEIAASMREVAEIIEKFPPQFSITNEVKTIVHQPGADVELTMQQNEKTYQGIVADVNDGIALIDVDMPLDEDGHADWPKFHEEHGERAVPDHMKITAERWMQEGTRLVIVISRHPGDEPVLEPRR